MASLKTILEKYSVDELLILREKTKSKFANSITKEKIHPASFLRNLIKTLNKLENPIEKVYAILGKKEIPEEKQEILEEKKEISEDRNETNIYNEKYEYTVAEILSKIDINNFNKYSSTEHLFEFIKNIENRNAESEKEYIAAKIRYWNYRKNMLDKNMKLENKIKLVAFLDGVKSSVMNLNIALDSRRRYLNTFSKKLKDLDDKTYSEIIQFDESNYEEVKKIQQKKILSENISIVDNIIDYKNSVKKLIAMKKNDIIKKFNPENYKTKSAKISAEKSLFENLVLLIKTFCLRPGEIFQINAKLENDSLIFTDGMLKNQNFLILNDGYQTINSKDETIKLFEIFTILRKIYMENGFTIDHLQEFVKNNEKIIINNVEKNAVLKDLRKIGNILQSRYMKTQGLNDFDLKQFTTQLLRHKFNNNLEANDYYGR